MGELKIFGYILVTVLLLTAIVLPLVEIFFAYRERLILSDALYNSCRVAAEDSYNYANMRNINAERREQNFRIRFAEAFEISFDLTCVDNSAEPLKFTSNSDAYNDFEVKLAFDIDYIDVNAINGELKTVTYITAAATSPYKFKQRYMQRFNEEGGINYALTGVRIYTMVVVN